MKKGLTMLVAAMAVLALIGSAAAATADGAIDPGSAAVKIAAILVFGAMVTIGAIVFMQWKAKKGHTFTRSRHSVKALNAVLVLVHRVKIIAVNARYAFTNAARATSPRMISRAHGTNFVR